MDGGMDTPKGSTPPPVGGLGNYKGVMLCNRPSDNVLGRPGSGPSEGQVPPFKPTISATHREQLGLQPCRQLEKKEAEIKTRGPSAALRRHCRWIKELQVQVKDEQQRSEAAEKHEADRKQKMQEIFKQQRDAIRMLKKEKDVEPERVMAILQPSSKKKAPGKPAWAMTEGEREEFDEAQADELMRFAEELDFDKYVGDSDFRECLRVVRDRAKHLQKEQDAFKDSIMKEFNEDNDNDDQSTSLGSPTSSRGGDRLDAASACSGSRRSAGGRRSGAGSAGQQEWDASTNCGDNVSVAASVRSDAAEILEANPQLKAVHSKGSVQKIMERAKAELPPVPES